MSFDTIVLDGQVIQFKIVPKNNKNTYFKFRKDGTLEITKSRYQSKKEIIKYMKQNAAQFTAKLNRIKVVPIVREGYYSYFGKEFEIAYHAVPRVDFDLENEKVSLPSIEVDPEGKKIRKAERQLIMDEVSLMIEAYTDNTFVDIKGIEIKARHTKTRFGSCNARRKTINLNANLVHYDKKYLEYVFLHEISHLNYQNHGREYYELLVKLSPNYKQLRKELREIYR